MNYKAELKKRIKALYPMLTFGKINLVGASFSIEVADADINLRQLEHELREALSMPGLLLIHNGA